MMMMIALTWRDHRFYSSRMPGWNEGEEGCVLKKNISISFPTVLCDFSPYLQQFFYHILYSLLSIIEFYIFLPYLQQLTISNIKIGIRKLLE